ncbi:MAG TPA: hypothetical protein VKF59_09530 [Candidatus Dormibacteraeota bacterium]|nr:hypothetical protein [Candidatus Dormibacteraeota bacterium]
MVDRHTQAGGAGVRLLVVMVVLAVGAYVAWGFVHRPAGTVVTSSPQDAQTAQQKALAFQAAQAKAQQTGRAVSVAETFTDAELSSLANQQAQARGLPFNQISLHSTAQGTIQGQARTQVAGQDLPVSLVGVPIISNGRVALKITSTQVGSMPLPGGITDQVTQSIRQPLELGQPITGFSGLRVALADGELTVSGIAEPS